MAHTSTSRLRTSSGRAPLPPNLGNLRRALAGLDLARTSLIALLNQQGKGLPTPWQRWLLRQALTVVFTAWEIVKEVSRACQRVQAPSSEETPSKP